MSAHPAGPLHAGIQAPPETAGPRPTDAAGLDALDPAVWPRQATRRDDGVCAIAGSGRWVLNWARAVGIGLSLAAMAWLTFSRHPDGLARRQAGASVRPAAVDADLPGAAQLLDRPLRHAGEVPAEPEV